jgi:hypothetical protein
LFSLCDQAFFWKRLVAFLVIRLVLFSLHHLGIACAQHFRQEDDQLDERPQFTRPRYIPPLNRRPVFLALLVLAYASKGCSASICMECECNDRFLQHKLALPAERCITSAACSPPIGAGRVCICMALRVHRVGSHSLHCSMHLQRMQQTAAYCLYDTRVAFTKLQVGLG